MDHPFDGTVPGACTGSLDGGEESYGSHGVRGVEDPVLVTADGRIRTHWVDRGPTT